MSGRVRGSFTTRVLAELAPQTPSLSCCRSALVAGMRATGDAAGAARRDADEGVAVVTSRSVAARCALQALGAAGMAARVERLAAPRQVRYRVVCDPPWRPAMSPRSCCARSFLRGAFLATGLVSRPGAAPQLEIGCTDAAAAAELLEAASRLSVAAAVTVRRGRPLLTVRTGGAVGDFLSTVGAQGSRLDFEEGRVEGEIRAAVNRTTNAETANLRRTVGAGVRQLRAVERLEGDPAAWRHLPGALREAAELRRRHPDEPLARLALRAGCSRQAMAGRLHRLVALAEAR